MSSKLILEVAKEITEARDSEIPEKLLKIKDILLKDDNPKKLKFEIYKYDLLEALSVSFKNEYAYIKDGWNLALELVKTFNLCTSDFSSNENKYQNVFLPNASENMLILAKKLQEKHVKSKGFSEEFLNYFRIIMKEYSKLATNNSFIALKCLKSQRLFQLLLNDEQYSSAIVMNSVNEIFKIKRNIIRQLDEKTIYLYLDELIYKMATTETSEAGLAIFQLLITMCEMDPNLIKLIIRRYKGIKLLINKWELKKIGDEIKKFTDLWDDANRNKHTDQDLDNKATIIQKVWRGYMERKQLKKANKSFSKFQLKYRARKELAEKKKQKRQAEDELKFQLLLEHRRRQRQRKLEMVELLHILPANQIEKYLDRQREYSARIIQSNFRGYRQRKLFNSIKGKAIRIKAAICIQRAVRSWLERLSKKRKQPSFYSRPAGLDPERREFLFDQIRKHLDSLPPHPRTEKTFLDLHEKSQRLFHDYVINQKDMRTQQQNIQYLLAVTNNDADLLLNAPKLSQITEDDINTFYTHKSKPVMLAAKEAHKKMLRKQRAKWYELLMDDSDSDEDGVYDENFDDLSNNIRNMNFNSNTNNYYTNADKTTSSKSNQIGTTSNIPFLLHKSVSKKDKNQLKTNNLRKSITKMMNLTPSQSTIWNVVPLPSTKNLQSN